jgi:angiopoietin 2
MIQVEVHMRRFVWFVNLSSNKGNDDGRILMQQHFGGTNFFSKTWVEFKSEFGDVDANYWIGNERLHQLTKDGRYGLRVDMLAKSNNRWYWAEYSTFRVYDESSGYTLNIGGYTGNAGDSLTYVNGRMFSTKDKDQDMWDIIVPLTALR